MSVCQSDILILGSGVAGLTTAIKVAKNLPDKKILVLTKAADNETNTGSITGFMAGCVARMVSHCHSRGEEFRKAWNFDIGKVTSQENSDGVLTLAIITLR